MLGGLEHREQEDIFLLVNSWCGQLREKKASLEPEAEAAPEVG